MNRKIFTLLIVIVIAGMVGCSYYDTATVTIDLGIYKQAKLSLFDRVLTWLAFSTPVTANQPPQDVDFETLQIHVTAPDMDTISQEFSSDEIIANNGTITLTVPAGAQRTFELVAVATNPYNNGEDRRYGGIATVDLTPGEVNLSIEIGRLVLLPDQVGYGYSSVTWDSTKNEIKIEYNKVISYENNGPEPLYFKVYHYNSAGSPSDESLIDTVAAPPLKDSENEFHIIYYYSNPKINESYFAQFYISAVNMYGEGSMKQVSEY